MGVSPLGCYSGSGLGGGIASTLAVEVVGDSVEWGGDWV